MSSAMAVDRPSPEARNRWWWALWTLLAASAAGIALFVGIPLASGDPALSRIPLNPAVASHYLSLMIHGLPGALALLLGPLQFVAALRARYPEVHRTVGRVYMVSVLIASFAGLFAAAVSVSGVSVQVAFVLLVAAWLYTLAQAYRTIRHGEVQLHRIWMIRNYTLTFTAVMLRLYLLAGLALKSRVPGLTFDEIYTTAAWASILVNIAVAEYFIVQRSLTPLLLRRPPRGVRITRSAADGRVPTG